MRGGILVGVLNSRLCETEINFNSNASKSIAREELLWYDTDTEI